MLKRAKNRRGKKPVDDAEVFLYLITTCKRMTRVAAGKTSIKKLLRKVFKTKTR